MNKLYLSGNLTKDPEIRHTQNGKAVTRVGIAVNHGYGDKKTTEFFNLVAWDKTAELMGKYLVKGSKILVEGRLRNNNYEKDGVKHYGVDVVVESFEFMDGKKSGGKETPDNDFADTDDMPF